MPFELQLKLKENPLYTKYLREHSIWYKKLIRNPESFKEFREAMRKDYGLRPSDKMNKAMDAFNLVSNLLSSMV